MSIALLVNIIIALLIAGFLYWFATQLIALIPMPPIIAQAVHTILIIAVVAIILFWIVIPILQMIAGMHISLPQVSDVELAKKIVDESAWEGL